MPGASGAAPVAMRALAALLAGLLVLGSSSGLPGAPGEAWRAKADGPLLEALDRGAGEVAMVVQGPPLAPPAVTPPDRAAWRAHWAGQAAPFLEGLRAEVARLGGEVTREVPAVGAAFVRVPAAAVPQLLSAPDVRRAGRDWAGAVLPAPIDAEPGPSPAVALDEVVGKVEAPDLWALGYRGEGVKLAVVGTGVRDTHEAFRDAQGNSRVTAWQDVTSDPCASPCDDNGLGTHNAHAAAGSGLANASVPEGAAPRASIVGVRIFLGGSGTWEDAQEGLQAAFDLGADVAANGWGGGCTGAGNVTAELAEALSDAGMASVFAVGGGGPGAGTVGCPARADRVVSAGYTDIEEVIAGPSGRGPCTWQGVTRTCPDLVAVGSNVQAASNACDTCYRNVSGSSVSAAQLAGVIALLEQAKLALKGADLGPAEAESLLKATAKDLGGAGADDDYGWGLAKARRAYALISDPPVFELQVSFAHGKDELRSYETNQLRFGLVSLGSAAVSGHVLHRVEQVSFGACPPSCDAVAIAAADIGLGFLDEFTSTYAFQGADHPPGDYRVTASFEYSYTDPSTGSVVAGKVERSASFVLKKVVWTKARAIPASAGAATPIFGALSLANVGNEDAGSVQFVERFNPRGHAPLPVAPPGQLPNGVFADPAPDSVNLLKRIDLTQAEYRWSSIGAVPQQGRWEARYNFLAAVPGSYAFQGTLSWVDELGHAFVEPFNQPAEVRVL